MFTNNNLVVSCLIPRTTLLDSWGGTMQTAMDRSLRVRSWCVRLCALKLGGICSRTTSWLSANPYHHTRGEAGGVLHYASPFARAHSSMGTHYGSREGFRSTLYEACEQSGVDLEPPKKVFRAEPSGDTRAFSPVRKVVTEILPQSIFWHQWDR